MFRHVQPAHHHACRCRKAHHTPRQQRHASSATPAPRLCHRHERLIDRTAVESGDETDAEQSDDGALCIDGYDLGDGFVVGWGVGGGEESDATELAEARTSLRSL